MPARRESRIHPVIALRLAGILIIVTICLLNKGSASQHYIQA
jgi:hypothetical protein